MTLNELENKIKALDAGRHFYVLNDPNGVSMYILKYNKKKRIWEYYFLDERGGISNYHSFSSEEEACDYVYKDAVEAIDIFAKAFTKAGIER